MYGYEKYAFGTNETAVFVGTGVTKLAGAVPVQTALGRMHVSVAWLKHYLPTIKLTLLDSMLGHCSRQAHIFGHFGSTRRRKRCPGSRS